MDVWSPEEVEDYEQWERDLGKPSDEPERDEWLAWAEAEFSWAKPLPSC